MVINNVESYCNDLDRSGSGSMSGFAGFGSINFHNCSSATPNIQRSNGVNCHPGSNLSGDDRNIYASYSPCSSNMPQEQSFSSCYEKRNYNNSDGTTLTTPYSGNIQIATINTSTMANTSLNTHSLPSSPLTVVSVPSPPEQKPTIEELEYRQSQLQQLCVIPSPSNSTSPVLERYYNHSPHSQNYQQLAGNQGMMSHDGSGFVQQLSPHASSYGQSCLSSVQSQSPPMDAPHFTQLNCGNQEVSGAAQYEANLASRLVDGAYQSVMINPANSSYALPEEALISNLDYSVNVENQQAIEMIGKNTRGFQNFPSYDNLGTKSDQSSYHMEVVDSSVNQQKLKSRKGGKGFALPGKPSDRLNDDELIRMSVRELNRWLRGFR